MELRKVNRISLNLASGNGCLVGLKSFLFKWLFIFICSVKVGTLWI